MTIFSLKNTKISNSLKIGSVLQYARSLRNYFFTVSLVLLFFFIFGLLGNNASTETLKKLLGSAAFSFILSFLCFRCNKFFKTKIKKPDLKEKLSNSLDNDSNIGEFLSYEAASAVQKATNFSKKHKLNEITSSILFYFLLKNNNLDFIFKRALINTKSLKAFLKKNLSTQKEISNNFSLDFQNVITSGARIAVGRKHERVMVLDLITALSEENETFKKALIDTKLKSTDIADLCSWLENIENKIADKKKFWTTENLRKKGSIAKDWANGYANLLEGFSRNITDLVRIKGYPDIIGQQKEIKEIERALSEREINNVIIVGEPGSGRNSIIEQVATRSDLGISLPNVNYNKFIQLNLNALLAQSENKEIALKILDNIFKEVVLAGDVILVINSLNFYLGEDKTFNIESVLSSYLSSPRFKLIVISDLLSYRKDIETNPSLNSLFRKVEVTEISSQQSLSVLETIVERLERKYKLFISFGALKEAISASDKYIQTSPFPEKAIDLLDETVIFVSQSKDKLVLASHIDKIISAKTKIPVGELEEKEKDILINLESLIHERLVNQEQAVTNIASSLRRARSGVSTKKGPMGSFLFLGPTGVGKTETAKALAAIYFGSEKSIIRLDMSEFQNMKDIERILGNESIDGLLTTKVRENPFSLVLLDEIEKAHPNVLNLFLQVLDEGYITDGLGRKISFNNTIVIATSNAGYKVILEAVESNLEWGSVKEALLEYIFADGIFKPEFVNRFDSTVVFGPLSKEHLIQIAGFMLKNIETNLRERDIEFRITEELKEKIAELGYNPTFGARAMKRAIQNNIEDPIAKSIISLKISRGDIIEVDPEGFKVRKV